VRVAMPFLFVVAAIVSVGSSAVAAQMPDPQAALGYGGSPTLADQSAPSAGEVGGAGNADCPCVQQPPWHGNVRGAAACQSPPRCRGSNVYQANPFAQLHWRQMGGCVTLPPCLPRFHALMREGYLLSPVPPALPRCHNCGTPIEGGF